MQRIKDYLLDPLPIAIACGNWLAISYTIWGVTQRRSFHLVYESLFTQVLFVLNFPSLLVGTVVGSILAELLNLPDWSNFLHILSASLISGVQWFLTVKWLYSFSRQPKSNAD
jgi:hypothetical protein